MLLVATAGALALCGAMLRDAAGSTTNPDSAAAMTIASALPASLEATTRSPPSGVAMHSVPPSACAEVGTVAPHVHFEQVKTYVGAVPIADLEVAMQDLVAALAHGAASDAATDAPSRLPRVHVVAVDGTLLNLMRWGRIVNDNDVDVGIVADGVPLGNVSAHYFAAMWRLAAAGFIDAPSPRQQRKLFDKHKLVKPGRCVLRPQFMQCRHRNGVIVDMFGPETLLSPLTGLTAADVLPPRPCRAFARSFPCPAAPLKALKRFTLQFDGPPPSGPKATEAHRRAMLSPTPAAGKTAWYEFAGCALLPLRAGERDRAHAEAILRTTRDLEFCGWPSLYAERNTVPECVALLSAAVGASEWQA